MLYTHVFLAGTVIVMLFSLYDHFHAKRERIKSEETTKALKLVTIASVAVDLWLVHNIASKSDPMYRKLLEEEFIADQNYKHHLAGSYPQS